MRLAQSALPLRAFAILMIASGCTTQAQEAPSADLRPIPEHSRSVAASAQTKSELGVSRWTSTVTDETITTFGYTDSGDTAVGWQVVHVPAETTDQKIAQTRFVLKFGTTGAAISISEEERPRMFEDSFAGRPDAMRVVELMLSDFGGQVPPRGDSTASTDLGRSSLDTRTLKPLDENPPDPQLVVETCSQQIKRRCGAISEQLDQASKQIAPNCGGRGFNATKLWSGFLEELGIGHPCSTAFNRYKDLARQSRECRDPIRLGPDCDCDSRNPGYLDSPQCN